METTAIVALYTRPRRFDMSKAKVTTIWIHENIRNHNCTKWVHGDRMKRHNREMAKTRETEK